MLSSRHDDVTAIATTVDFARKKSIIDAWKILNPPLHYDEWKTYNRQ